MSQLPSTARAGGRAPLLAFAAACLLLLPIGAWADWGALNMPVGVTEISREVQALHMRIFWICVAIGTVVFGIMIVSMFLHRKSRGVTASTFHESTRVEVVWTVAPLLILIAMAVPAARVLIQMEDFSDSEMSIKVTGYQWRWHYDYLGEGVEFYSALDREQNIARQLDSDVALDQFGDTYLREVDNELVVPVGRKIRFLNTSGDVIHSWWVHDLALKKDAIPGFINENWATIEEPGVYRGKCAELCGRDHGFMPIVVRAVPAEEFDTWLADKKAEKTTAANDDLREWGHDELLARGESVYSSNCAGCHQAQGQGIPNLFPPIAGSPVATGKIEAHLATVLDGVEGTPMTAWSGTLSDADIAAVVTYQRNAFGNATGDDLQPTDVAAARGDASPPTAASAAGIPTPVADARSDDGGSRLVSADMLLDHESATDLPGVN